MERADSSMVWTFQTFLDIVELSRDVIAVQLCPHSQHSPKQYLAS